MKLYLKWLDRYERREDEEAPIGLILCTEASRERVELLEMHKDGIVVAEYWTALPPKAELEARIRAIYRAAAGRVARRDLPPASDGVIGGKTSTLPSAIMCKGVAEFHWGITEYEPQVDLLVDPDRGPDDVVAHADPDHHHPGSTTARR